MNMFNSPSLVAVDASGFVFIFDEGNHKIRMLNPNTTIVTTMADGVCRDDFN